MEQTRESYTKKLSDILRYSGLDAQDVIALANSEPRRLERLLMGYIEVLKSRGVSSSIVKEHLQVVKHLLVMNDLENSIPWSKLSKLMPRARKVGIDRAPSRYEIRKLLEHADIRLKALILLLASSALG